MTNILVADFVLVLLIFLRIISAMVASPVFSNKALPVIPKIFISFVIAYIVFLSVDTAQVKFDITVWSLFFFAVKEIITGLIIGFMMNFVFYGISFAGHIIGFDMGLTIADVFNPMEETNNNVVGEVIYISALLVFFLINGHHYLIRGLAYSFSVVQLGKFSINASVYDLLVKYSASIFIIAVKISSPILVSFFLVHLGEAVIARVMPQVQIFFVTQPLKIGIGFLLIMIAVPFCIYVIKILLKDYENNLFTLVKAMGS
ncbi:MAG: flagellar biosynthetic protein FliR [Ignavibacteriales bacterium]|nr:MAG: flagellar biosynthetic protein FliR [Ignavibacteriales bacterium]